ncbi:MAG: hypothetical protein AAB691_04245 [Patescibacteria group bacterium]
MSKNLAISILVAIVVGLGAYFFFGQPMLFTIQSPIVISREEITPKPFDPLNATYSIDEEAFTLTNGKSETELVPGSAIKDEIETFGKAILGDLDRDGKDDAAILFMENSGGTGIFYYVAAALRTSKGALGTNAIFLGDRIAPQTLEIRNNIIIVNYADRKENEPMAAQPSVGVTKYFVVSQNILRETENIPQPNETADQ